MKAAFPSQRRKLSCGDSKRLADDHVVFRNKPGLGCMCSQGFTQGPSGRQVWGTPPRPPTLAVLPPSAGSPGGGRLSSLQLPRDMCGLSLLQQSKSTERSTRPRRAILDLLGGAQNGQGLLLLTDTSASLMLIGTLKFLMNSRDSDRKSGPPLVNGNSSCTEFGAFYSRGERPIR